MVSNKIIEHDRHPIMIRNKHTGVGWNPMTKMTSWRSTQDVLDDCPTYSWGSLVPLRIYGLTCIVYTLLYILHPGTYLFCIARFNIRSFGRRARVQTPLTIECFPFVEIPQNIMR